MIDFLKILLSINIPNNLVLLHRCTKDCYLKVNTCIVISILVEAEANTPFNW